MLRSGRSRRAGLPFGAWLALAALITAFLATPADAQIRQPPPPTAVKPVEPIRQIPLLKSDVIIQSVKVTDQQSPSPITLALVTVKNQGQADAVFPAGSVLARGDASQAGGLAFQNLTTPAEFLIAAGSLKYLTLTVGDVCSAGKPGPVTFRIDPDNVVAESNETNNAQALQASSFSSGDLRPTGVGLVNPPRAGQEYPWVDARYPADEYLNYVNEGTGPVLWCPGQALWRETASPLSGKYGLRELKNTGTKIELLQPTGMGRYNSKIPGAFQPADLPPGTYNITAVMNPDGRMRESNTSNSTVTSPTTVK